MAQTYTREQRISAMRAAGWPAAVIPVGVAVSLAESWSGVGVNNNPPTEYSVGPWQINLLAHSNISEGQAMDLNYSTQYALSLWRTQGFQPWGAYTNGSYLKYVEAAPAATDILKPPVDSPEDRNRPSSGKGATTSGVTPNAPSGNALTSFQFPSVDLGPWKIDTSGAFKIALSVGALFLVFKGLGHIAE